MARRAFIDAGLCDGRADCQAMNACPTKSFMREDEKEPWFIGPTCLGCGRCLTACDLRAIALV
ncbi:hypothetical protein [Moorella sulfitireducens (nom. illeg.)]|uniref:hypothetical protein n=1 Tax=Neomoorella sulfitireducens TaxID=2972948 RepID=UPI0021ABABC0|nr:hypothetical protein [Moorella sulfitireducens]